MNQESLTKMKQLKFYGMANAFRLSLEDGRQSRMTTDEMISFPVESEWDDRKNRRIYRTLPKAKFPSKANSDPKPIPLYPTPPLPKQYFQISTLFISKYISVFFYKNKQK